MKFEYKTITFSVSNFWGSVNVKEADFDKELNRLGAQGWELVNALDINVMQGASKDLVAIFKRAL